MSQIIAQGWRLYRKHFGTILGVVLVVWVPLELASSYMDHYFFKPDDFRKSFRFAQLLENFVGIVATAGVIFVGVADRQGIVPEVGAALTSGIQAWGRMLWTRVMAGFCIVIGLIVLIVPGIYLLVRLSLVEPIVCSEGISGGKAMQRSFELTQGRFWIVFRLGLVLFGLLMMLLIAILLPAVLLAVVVPEIDNFPFDATWSLIIDVAAAFATLCIYAAYVQFAHPNELERQVVARAQKYDGPAEV